MANFKIVPYEKHHGDEMVEFGLNHKLMDIDASYTETRIDTKVFGLSFTLLADNNPILSGGIIPFFGMELLKVGLWQVKEFMITKLKQLLRSRED